MAGPGPPPHRLGRGTGLLGAAAAPPGASASTSPCLTIPVTGSGLAFGYRDSDGNGPAAAIFTGTLAIREFTVNPYHSSELWAIGAVTGTLSLEDGTVVGTVTEVVLVGPLRVTAIEADRASRSLTVALSGNVLKALGTMVSIAPATLTLCTGALGQQGAGQLAGLIHALPALLDAQQLEVIAQRLNAVCTG